LCAFSSASALLVVASLCGPVNLHIGASCLVWGMQ
jgi:hypothetical protein